MADSIRCPNPACTAVFKAEALRGASRFSCPRCGKAFLLRAGPPSGGQRGNAGRRAGGSGALPPATPARQAVDVAAEFEPDFDVEPLEPQHREPIVPPKSAAKVVPPPAPPPPPVVASVAAAEPAGFDFAPAAASTPIIATPRRRPRRRVRSAVAKVVVFVAAMGAAAWGTWWFNGVNRKPVAVEEAPAMAGSHTPPALGAGWKRDRELQLRMQVGLAARRSQPTAAMAFAAHDYKTRVPGEGELIDEALAKLHFQFKRVERENATREAQLGGRAARAFDFEATDADDVDVRGTAYLLGHRGYGYWLMAWAPVPETEQAAPELERLRASFALNPSFREGWQGRGADVLALAMPEAGAALAPPKGVWGEEEKTGYDPKAILVLKGTFPGGGPNQQRDRHAGKVAIVQALLVDVGSKESTPDAARTYVVDAEKDPDRGNYPKTTAAVIKDKDGEAQKRETDLGKVHGWLVKLKVTNTEDRERFAVLGVVPRPGNRALILWCDCDWSLRDYWEQEFVSLLNTLRPFKSGEDASKAKANAEEKPAE